MNPEIHGTAEAHPSGRSGAIVRLILATAAWGLSFPAAKAVMATQQQVLPGLPEWFHTAFVLLNRMLIAVAVMLILMGLKRVRGLSKLELRQGIELGLFGGLGMLCQTHAQHSIPASTSAFYTQFTCILIPLSVAVQRKKFPQLSVIIACALVMLGCGILSEVTWGSLTLGTGEWITILSAALFTGQILCLERSAFKANDAWRTVTVMFAVKALLFLPLVIAGGGAKTFAAYQSAPIVGISALLAVVCTVYAYATMTRWQPSVTSTQAGMIYATEPIFASGWALFLPGFLSAWAGIQYANEVIHKSLLIGGALILIANILLILKPEK